MSSVARRTPGPTPLHRGLRQEGFTLLELMIIVVIIGISAALAMPAIHGTIAERKNSEAGYDLVRLMRHARSEALAYGRAHLVRFESTSYGSFTVYRGISSNCNLNDWDPIIAAGVCGESSSMCIDEVVMMQGADDGSGGYELGGTRIQATESGGAALVDLCYQPTGILLHRTVATARFSDQNTIAGGYLFLFQRLDSGSPVGVTRRVVVPMSGDPRTLR